MVFIVWISDMPEYIWGIYSTEDKALKALKDADIFVEALHSSYIEYYTLDEERE